LVQVTVTNNWRSEFTYDGFGRRRVRTEYVWQNNAWVVQAVVRYVYDGLLVMQERDGNNVPQVTYTRGRDLSGSRQRAGGIGGLLARTDNAILISGASRAHAYYHADGNGNITFLATDKATVAARYLYDPFGNLLAKAGPLADANLYRFSSKELHANSGLYYYGFRFYEPGLQRWASRDPIAERAGINLYGFVDNSPVAQVDLFGLYDDDAHDPYIKEDHCFWSHPYTPWGYWRHFRRLDKVEKDLAKDVAQGKYERFKRHMHQGQDYFAHYRMGYRWYTLGHAFAGHAPDVRFRDHPVEWQNYLLMLAWTADWEAMWRAQNEADDPWTD
jgi:RHS repeat-associated protein